MLAKNDYAVLALHYEDARQQFITVDIATLKMPGAGGGVEGVAGVEGAAVVETPHFAGI